MKEKKPYILHFTELDSTNNYISAHKDELEDGDICIADFQTAGKGQRGNGWESEEGKNLTFSILLKPQKISSTHQFIISQAVTLGIVSYLAERGIEAKIKWPNDIYV
ncbi:MAG: biotin--[acetyl-CoA-carboxylase] ligase, partial [Bacteroidales bacterium]|nr:biotin--[acetyl-CoA-carboxylase] ligase [Bacteroidales bacterium]